MGSYGKRFPAGLRGLTLLVTLLLHGCGGLPEDFESLPLEEQVVAYEQHWARGGSRSRWARIHIAWHGWEAADLMSQYLTGERVGIPKSEAVLIIRQVQLRGCSLHGTAAENALQELLETDDPSSTARFVAVGALECIKENLHYDAADLVLKGGPCQGHTVGGLSEQ